MVDEGHKLGRGFFNKHVQKRESQAKFFFKNEAKSRMKQLRLYKNKSLKRRKL